jgi:hypothetical protein
MKKYIIFTILIITTIWAIYFIKQNSKLPYNSNIHPVDSGEMHMQDHAMLEINKQKPIPSVDIEMTKDVKDGYNLHIKTENFTFTPENVNTQNIDNQGHAHIFINDKKLTRVYGNWYYISSDKLKEGQNKIEVTLNANNHSELTIDGKHISATKIVSK